MGRRMAHITGRGTILSDAYPSTTPMKRSRMLVIGRPLSVATERATDREPWPRGDARASFDLPR
jgi:hypothetical protein